ncbi:MAG: LamG domain-containing protein [bacterium]|nr:LamG domain-containing protein [bacterium]
MRRFTLPAALVLMTTIASAQPSNGLAAHWTFDNDDAPGLRIMDGSPNHCDGQLHGAAWAPADEGQVLIFSDNAHRADMGAPKALGISGPITLELWLKASKVPGAECGIAGKSIQSYGLTWYKDGRCYWYIGDGGNKCSASLATGLWIHITATFDGETMRLYVNGEQQDQHTSRHNTIPSDADFQIGRIRRAANQPAQLAGFPGAIDDVRVYTRALTAEEALAHFNEEATRYGGHSSSDAFALYPYYYPESQQLLVDVDASALFPVPKALNVALRAVDTEDGRELGSAKLDLAQGGLIVRDAALTCEAIDGSRIRVVAQLIENGKVRAEKTAAPLNLDAPPLPSAHTQTAPPLPAKPDRPTPDLKLTSGGAFTVGVGGSSLLVRSSFSYPDGGYNEFGPGERKPEPAWKPRTENGANGEFRASAAGTHYTLDRVMKVLPGRVLVHDTFTNTTEEPIGILVDHTLDGSSFEKVRVTNHENPSVFLEVGDMGAGLVALDDVFLEHYATTNTDKTGALSSHKFALDAKASYTLEWAVYVTAPPDYYAFINAIREDESLIRLVEGAFAFIGPHGPVPTEEFIRWRGVKYLSLGCLSNPPDEPGLSLEGVEFAEYPKLRVELNQIFDEIHETFPDMKTMFHVAHSLYTTNRPEELFPGARTIDANGRQTMYGGDNRDYYIRYFDEPFVDDGWRWYIFYPTMDNSYGPVMLDAIDQMIAEIGCKSLFADGYTHGYGGRFTYDRWDGHTADIDPDTKRITRTYASVNLLANDVLVETARRIREAGGVVICNSYPGPRSVSSQPNVLYCMEGASGAINLTRLYLTPSVISLGNHILLKGKGDREVYDDILDKLEYGGLYWFYGETMTRPAATVHMYPITQEEIGPGWVKGPERIVTRVSGVYGWTSGPNLHRTYRWDGRGMPTHAPVLTTVDDTGVRSLVDLRHHELAVIEPIPVTLEAESPVNLYVREYGPDGIRLDLSTASGPVRLAVRTGEFALRAGASYAARVGENPEQRIKASGDGVLAFDIQALADGQPVAITLCPSSQ